MCNAYSSSSAASVSADASNGDVSKAAAARLSSASVTASKLYLLCLEAKPPVGGWFSVADTATRLSLAVYTFYRILLFRPLSLLRFAYGWNSLWYGRAGGLLLTVWLPYLPLVLCALEVVKRAREKLPWAEEDWKMQGPGRVFFVRPDSFVASLLWDFYLAVSVFCGSFMQYGTDPDGLEHTWYDAITTKEYWMQLLDGAGARRPLQLGRWDGERLHDVGPGLAHGHSDLVCKISDSYLGIGDRVFRRGKAEGGDFDSREDVDALLAADAEYAGKPALLAELIYPTAEHALASAGYSNVHSLDIVTLRTRHGVKVLTCLLWTDCLEWSSHSCQAGYIVDVHSETVVAPTAWCSPEPPARARRPPPATLRAFSAPPTRVAGRARRRYSPYFARQHSNLLGTRLPGVRAACDLAVAAHERSTLPWLTSVGWDAMLTPEGVSFFEGNVAAYRTPRRMFLTPKLTAEFLRELGC